IKRFESPPVTETIQKIETLPQTRRPRDWDVTTIIPIAMENEATPSQESFVGPFQLRAIESEHGPAGVLALPENPVESPEGSRWTFGREHFPFLPKEVSRMISRQQFSIL